MTAKLAADPHRGGALLRLGASRTRARCAAILLHGRGGDGVGMAEFLDGLGFSDVALFAPEAAGRSWWPTSFLAPAATMEPFVQSAIGAVDRAVWLAGDEGFAPAQTFVIGFSQGGCLALEHAARTATPFAGVFGLSAALVGTGDAGGPPREDLYGFAAKDFGYASDLAGHKVHIGCHERDPHIPIARVMESAAVFRQLGAAVSLATAPGANHGPTEGDVDALRNALAEAAAQ
ncbi:phospholipase [Acuticoccus sp. MNP-M23]|uniref:alpha/beta hydrolase n=1 Tax=Acuticoccus sp. MNP-M23 TaxID=3072793 RepID=UPI0028156FB2|nr:phospholipase [Acuticoccus sp. MNP-M23]WMS42009.1 phospholipase [Acuticoccus sp. MNP-M23]